MSGRRKGIPHCPQCDRQGIRNERHDAYYCPVCDLWLEQVCSCANAPEPLTGEPCYFCHGRPEKPSIFIASAVKHYEGCNPNYPEKVEGEAPQMLTLIELEGHYIHQCVDCGAFFEEEE